MLARTNANSLQEILTILIKQRTLARLAKEEAFGEVLMGIGELISDSESEEDRLKAFTSAARISAVAKTVKPRVEAMLRKSCSGPLPPASLLEDADARLYIATGLKMLDGDWIAKYAAISAVEEESGEKARAEFLAALIDRSVDLATALRHLVEPLSQFAAATENPGDSTARRFRRLVSALRPAMVNNLSPAGPDVARQLKDLVHAVFRNNRVPESADLKEAVAEDLASLIHDLVRTRVQVMADSVLYSAIELPRSWFDAAYWRYFAQQSPAIKLLTQDLTDAVILLGKQGLASDGLARELAKLLGSRDEARSVLRNVGELRADLPSNIRNWLITGRTSGALEGSEATVSSAHGALDSRIATALADSQRLEDAIASISPDATAELGLINPSLAASVGSLASRASVLLKQVLQMAERRNLRIAANRGDIQDYSPVTHTVFDNKQPTPRVRLITPLIERVSAQGAEVVVKAIVEPVAD